LEVTEAEILHSPSAAPTPVTLKDPKHQGCQPMTRRSAQNRPTATIHGGLFPALVVGWPGMGTTHHAGGYR